MAIGNFNKYLSTATPNLSLQSNITQFLLWGTAGVLSGLDITSVVFGTGPTAGKVIITLTPGAFIHNGIVVDYPDGIVVPPLTPTATPSLSNPMYLVVTANGADAGSIPAWSFIAESTYRAQPDYKNFAAVIGIYRLQIVPNAIVQQVGFTNDVSAGFWTQSPAAPAVGRWQILNGSDATLSGYVLNGVAGNVAVVAIENLGSNAKSVTQCILTARVAVNNVVATTLRSTNGLITVAGPAGPPGQRFSAFANGIEVFYDTVGVGESTATIVAGLVGKINMIGGSPWTTIATATNTSPTITLTSVQYGQAGNFDLQVTTNSAATIVVTTQPSNGVQGRIKVEFPAGVAAASGVDTFKIYPPVPLPTGPVTAGAPTVMLFPIVMTNITATTFNNLDFKITAEAPGAETVSIGQTFITLSITELASAIDPIPPTQLSHWVSGPVVSVGAGEGTSLQAHRFSDPIDHLDRSIPGSKIKTRAIGPLEISQLVVGVSFQEGFHTVVQLDQPWLISPPSDLNLEESSDLIKSIARALGAVTTNGAFSAPGNLLAIFAKDHNPTTGRHKAVTYANLVTTPVSDGMQVDPLSGGDLTIDPRAAWPTTPVVPPVAVTTQGQFAVLSDLAANASMFSVRKATNVPKLGAAPVTIRDLVISSPAQAISGAGPNTAKIGLAIGLDDANPHVTGAYREEDAKPLSGFSSFDNIPSQGLINNEVTLFEGWVVFVRIDGAWTARTNPAAMRFFTDLALGAATNADGGAAAMDQSNSFLPDSPGFGAAYYADFGSPNNFLSGEKASAAPENCVMGLSTALVQLVTGLGYFPTPVKEAGGLVTGTRGVAFDANSGSEWLYLPFPKKDIFGSVSVQANVFSVSGATAADGTSAPSFYHGIMVAPAYDARELIVADSNYQLIAPVYAPTTGAFKSKSTGLVRRHPWVLTPYGMGRRIDFSADLSQEDSYFYNPSNLATDTAYDPYKFFTRPLADYAGALSRDTRFRTGNIGLGALGDNSYIIRGALPFYDRRRSTETALSPVSGVVVNAAQISSFSGINAAYVVTTTQNRAYRFASCGGTVPLVSRYIPSPTDPTRQDFLRVGGVGNPTAVNRTADGIAVCVHRFDFGIAGKAPTNILGINAPPPGGVVPYNQTKASPNFVEAPIAIHLKITGTLLDRLKLAMSL